MAEASLQPIQAVEVVQGEHIPNPLTEGKPKLFILSFNISKKTNVGNLVRSAVAFGAHELIVVGTRAARNVTGLHSTAYFAGDTKIGYFGDKGTKRYLYVRHFPTLTAAKEWMTSSGITVCGIEIGGESVDVVSKPFKGSTAFVLGNEGSGMSDAAKAICDHFVYIKHFGQGTASLNVTVAGSIVLHHFAEWAGYAEAPRSSDHDEKYNVTEIKYDFSVRSEAAKLKAAQRAAKRARATEHTDVAATASGQ